MVISIFDLKRVDLKHLDQEHVEHLEQLSSEDDAFPRAFSSEEDEESQDQSSSEDEQCQHVGHLPSEKESSRKRKTEMKYINDQLFQMGQRTYQWGEEVAAIQQKMNKMEKKIHKLEREFFKRITGEQIIAFVREVKRAVKYFGYMNKLRGTDFIKPKDDFGEMLKRLVKEQKGVEKSKKVSRKIISDALDVRVLELNYVDLWKNRQNVYRNRLKDLGVKNVESVLQLTYPDIKDVKAEDVYLHENPISSLVFQTLEKEYVMHRDPKDIYMQEYVMHRDPKVELLKIIRLDPTFVHEHFNVRGSPIEESSVAEALAEYSKFHSEYVEASKSAKSSRENAESKAETLDEKHLFTGDTISLGQIEKLLSMPIEGIKVFNGGMSGKKRKCPPHSLRLSRKVYRRR